MARHNSITCDWCGQRITDTAITYGMLHLQPYATHEGARYSSEFCSAQCLQAYLDHGLLDSIGCEFSWQEPGCDHRCVCQNHRYVLSNHGGDRECWCEQKHQSHAKRPDDWPERRLREHLLSGIEERVAAAVVRPRLERP